MNVGQTIFSQLMDFVPSYEFHKCVERYQGNYKVRSFTCSDQFRCMIFAQLTYRESLRDIEACLRASHVKLYHMGFRSPVSRNTLANANSVRDWRIFADFAQVMVKTARKLYIKEEFGAELSETLYALDSTTIDLCLSIFPWAAFRKQKGAVKMHTLLDLRGSIPTVIFITAGKVHDVNILDNLMIESGAVYIMDRGYIDFARLYRIHTASGFFVTRAKKGFKFKRLYSASVDKSSGVMFDQTVRLTGQKTCQDYPDKLRRVGFLDAEQKRRFVFITNNFVLPSHIIAPCFIKSVGRLNCSLNGSNRTCALNHFTGQPKMR